MTRILNKAGNSGMTRLLSAAKLDFYACKSMLKLISLLVLIGVVIGLAAHGPEYTMMFIMVFGVTSSGSVFSVHEKSHSDKLYGILPLKKSEMILGRYLFALMIGLAYVIVGGILGFVMWRIMGANANLTALAYWATLAAAFIYFGFATGVAYPIYFKFTFAKAYVFTMIPMYVIVVGFLILTRKGGNNLANTLSQAIKFFTPRVYLLPIFGLLGGLILLGVSALLANLIYTRKEI